MNLQKITKIGCITLGVFGIIFLFLVFGTGDDTIKMSAASGDFGVITPIILLSQLILFIAVIVTLTFSLRGIAKDKAKMKSALTSAGLFLVVVVTRKKIKSRKAISAIDPALTSGDFLLAIVYFLINFFPPEKIISPTATITKM